MIRDFIILCMYVLSALQRIKEAEENNNVKTRMDEVEKLLRNIIKMPQKVLH